MRQETTCHKCLRSHSRGPVNAVDVYRCLHCGIDYKRLSEDAEIDLALRIHDAREKPRAKTFRVSLADLGRLIAEFEHVEEAPVLRFLRSVFEELVDDRCELVENEGAIQVWRRRTAEAEEKLAGARAEERKWFGDYCRNVLGGLALDLFVAGDFVDEMLKMREGIEKYPYNTDDPIWYKPSLGGREFAGVVDSELRALGDSFVLRLREMEPDYARIHHPGTARTTVKAASVHALRPRALCVCGHKLSQHEPKPSAEVVPEVLACTVTDCACGPGCIHEGYVDADTGGAST